MGLLVRQLYTLELSEIQNFSGLSPRFAESELRMGSSNLCFYKPV